MSFTFRLNNKHGQPENPSNKCPSRGLFVDKRWFPEGHKITLYERTADSDEQCFSVPLDDPLLQHIILSCTE